MKSELIMQIFEILQAILAEVKESKKAIKSIPNWISASDVALDKGLKTQSVLKQLYTGDFEPEVDFKKIGNKIYIAKGVVFKIRRLRK